MEPFFFYFTIYFLSKNCIYLRCFDIHTHHREMTTTCRLNSSIFWNVTDLSWKGPPRNISTFILFGSQQEEDGPVGGGRTVWSQPYKQDHFGGDWTCQDSPGRTGGPSLRTDSAALVSPDPDVPWSQVMGSTEKAVGSLQKNLSQLTQNNQDVIKVLRSMQKPQCLLWSTSRKSNAASSHLKISWMFRLRHSAKCFTWVILLNPHNNLTMLLLVPLH